MSEFKWATVTALGPLRIRLDGEAVQLPITPDSLIDPTVLAVSDRVRVEISNKRVIIAGRGGGLPVIIPPGFGPAPFAGSAAPAGWLLCDGSAVSRTTYAALFTAIGTTYGVGNGSTTFNVPDMRQRTAFGAQAATSLGTVTFDSTTDIATLNNHGMGDGDRFYFTGGTAPTGLALSVRYFARDVTTHTFKLAATLGGAAINFTANGSGTRTLFLEDFPLGYAGGVRVHNHRLDSGFGYHDLESFASHVQSVSAPSWTPGNSTGASSIQWGGGNGSTRGAGMKLGGTVDAAAALPPYLAVNFIIKT